ncbi:reverse transcriptase domain-containing protein [Pseudomonas serbiensis]|uniref:reverse transcriptase domain-containing protein n=1 Tax=Pseudomonas serbiensis TaxID=3064350 RepID=UPI0038621C12
MQFTALLHHITPQLLAQGFYALRRDAAIGVDGVSWREYEEGLLQRLNDLHTRLHNGAYRATPSRRVFIPKADGRQRPLGIASLDDKIVQQAVVIVLNAIYEEDFLGFSYGVRPGRSQYDALDALTVALKGQKVNWTLDADITSFFDEIDHEWMLMFLGHRIADRRLLGLICKWLQAGVVEDGRRVVATKGTPQGAVISPLLANIYLHYLVAFVRLCVAYGGTPSNVAASVIGFNGHATDALPTSTYQDPEMHILTLRIASRHVPKAGAVYGSSARTDLCGGDR